MKAYSDKNQENKSHSVQNSSFQKQESNSPIFQLMDNRPEAIAQSKLQEMVNNSHTAMQMKVFQDMADRPKVKEMSQLQDTNNTIQRFPFDKDGNDLGGNGRGAGGDLKGSGALQIGGGFLTAAANVIGTATGLFNTADLLPVAERQGPLPPGRRELQNIVDPYRTGEDSRASEMAEMITGQNGAQSLMRQPVGENAIQAFEDQLKEMQAVKDRPRSEQYAAELSGHKKLVPAFWQDHKKHPHAGLWSGSVLHSIGALYSGVMGTGHSIKENPEMFAQKFLDAQLDDDTNFPGGLK